MCRWQTASNSNKVIPFLASDVLVMQVYGKVILQLLDSLTGEGKVVPPTKETLPTPGMDC